MSQTFNAFRVHENEDGSFRRVVECMPFQILPKSGVLIRVHYSGLNYKDALSAFGNKGVTRKYPHTPGIDAAGEIIESPDKNFSVGEKVIVTGFDLGMNTPGGFGEYINVPSEWIVKLPAGLDLFESMKYGTAGFTAAAMIQKMIHAGLDADQGPVIVTGAAGGVGSVAVLILKKLGFKVFAGTSNIEDSKEIISKLGADGHLEKSSFDDESQKTLLPGKWAGAIDCVGGNVLTTLLKSTKEQGIVVTCGSIYSHELNMTVFPFILRGVSLLGVTSQNTPIEQRKKIWHLLASEYKISFPDIIKTISLNDLENALQLFIKKKNRGRVVLRHGD